MRFVLHASAATSAAAGLLLWACAAPSAAGAPKRVDASGKPQTGQASFYGTHDAGEKTASGAPFDPKKLTAASRTLPLGTKAKVTNKETGQSAKVTVTDRGPYVKGRILDVSPKAASKLGMKESGVAPVKIQPLEVPKPASK